jgi:hypothetical protein
MKCAQCLTLSAGLAVVFFGAAVGTAAEPEKGGRSDVPAVRWRSDYAKATAVGQRDNKMLFIFFHDAGAGSPCDRFEKETLDDPQVRRKLQDYVCLRLPLSAKVAVQDQDKPIVLLEHDAFSEMLGKPGIAVVDYRTKDAKLRGQVISQFPLTDTLWYTAEQMAVILTLPPGTLTQRTLIYAVRTHPDHPASTDGEMLPVLSEEAEEHAQYQANVRVLGHQFWDSRFRRILSRLPGGGAPREVCAQSWGHENLVEAAIECVRSWRLSSGHWSAVRSRSRFFGYDMKRGANGVWYATGIVDGR